MTTQDVRNQHADFSLVLGGPLFQLLRKAQLSGDTLQLLRRRTLVLTLLAWAPLLVLSAAEGRLSGDSVDLPFLHDVEMHLRLLVALPLLILAEVFVHQWVRPMVGQFLERRLIPDAARARFDKAVASAMRLRNSITVEVLMIAIVYIVGVGILWRTQVAPDRTSWYGVATDGKLRPSLAGWWMGCVSLPLFQFLFLRWYFRLFVWARFLWQVSRIRLKLVPTHPDRCGGLGFLSIVSQAFSPVLLAQGVMLAGLMANRILFAGAKLPDFKVELIGLVAVMVFAILGPLLVFAPQVAAARRIGLWEYGTLAQRYAREFDDKWLRGGAPAGESLMGSADIQSLADLGNSFEIVKEMNRSPVTWRTTLHLAVMTLLPVTPLFLTVVPLDQLIRRLLEIVL